MPVLIGISQIKLGIDSLSNFTECETLRILVHADKDTWLVLAVPVLDFCDLKIQVSDNGDTEADH